jgi:4-diphosphocytidyl-2-C-methyl-D-erythritol kinase
VGEADPVVETAPAKLNLFLRVLGRRDDGYHDVETVILPLSLADQVRVEPIPDDLRVITSGPLAEEVPEGEENLALHAAVRLRDSLQRKDGAKIGIDKRIPVAAGLGGGSADAAATLRVLGRAWSAGASALGQVAALIGSDVPALLEGGPVLVWGRGESVEPIEAPPTSWVLLTHSFGVSAADAYRWWDEDGGRSGQPQSKVAVSGLRSTVSGFRSSPNTRS